MPGLLLGLVALGVAGAVLIPRVLWAGAAERTPMELVRYAEQRLIGHPNLEMLAEPLLQMVRRNEQREPPQGLPTLGKGQQPYALAWPLYDAAGRPQAVSGQRSKAERGAAQVLGSIEALAAAMARAKPGDVLELLPGTYKLTSTLDTRVGGEALRPIVVRAAEPGKVIIESSTLQAFVVSKPFWTFENLELRGTCKDHDACEHAFHIVGGARSTVLLNNMLVDFNSPVKVNGEGDDNPDDGLLQFNTLTNTAPRRTATPVSVLDMVGPSGWTIVDNHVERFVKEGGNSLSYGLCVKGGGHQVRVERNLVVCTPEDAWQPGSRVGISLGCGLTGASYCRGGKGCDAEHTDGLVANNVVAHCNDFGIDLNKARGAVVSHNTLVNTAGIDLRGNSSADTYGNLVEGRERARDQAELTPHGDLVLRRLSEVLTAPESLDLRWRGLPDAMRPTPENGRDFCAKARPIASPPGATIQARCDLPP